MKLAARRFAGLVAGAAVLAAAGCNSSYNGERLFWKAQKASAVISENPAEATPEQFRASEEAFQRVITDAPGTTWAGKAQLAIGSLWALQKDFEQARQAYTLVLRNHGNQRDVALSARYAIAKTYEMENKWDDAVKMYDQIAEHHAWTRMGLESPLYIGAVYQKLNRDNEAEAAFRRAVRDYLRLAPEAPTPELKAQVKGFLAASYQQLQEWDKALEQLEELAAMPSGTNRPLLLMSIASIYQVRLGNADKAKEYYLKIVQEFPDDKLAAPARERLQKLGVPVETFAPAPSAATPAVPVAAR